MTGSVAAAPMRWNLRASSSGMASAPEAHSRIEVRSRSPAPASSIIPYMAGTPTNIPARRVSMASRDWSGRNLGSR